MVWLKKSLSLSDEMLEMLLFAAVYRLLQTSSLFTSNANNERDWTAVSRNIWDCTISPYYHFRGPFIEDFMTQQLWAHYMFGLKAVFSKALVVKLLQYYNKMLFTWIRYDQPNVLIKCLLHTVWMDCVKQALFML